MAGHEIAYMCNDKGLKEICVGVKQFMCMGASSPFDHPHVFLDMGEGDYKTCPYCGTIYHYDRTKVDSLGGC